MANNLIQIKRSTSTATPSSLNAGELAYSNTSKILFIGSTDGGTVVPIAGSRNPGVLTANQALVANSTSGIDQLQVGNVTFVGTTQTISANGSTGTAGYVLASGSSSANIFWINPSTFSVNTSAQYSWSNTQTFQNTITFSTSLLANSINATSYNTGGGYGSATGGILANSTAIAVGNNTVNAVIIGNSTVVYFTGTAYNANQTLIANNSSYLNGYTFAAPPVIGSTTANGVSLTYANVSGQVNTATLYATTSANIASAVQANATGIWTTGTVNGATLSVSTTFVANSTNLIFTGAQTSFSGANLSITGTNMNVSSNVTFSANITTSGALTSLGGTNTSITSNATFAANVNFTGANLVLTGTNISGTTTDVTFRNGTFSGNLVVSGSVTTINTTSLTVQDNIIELGSNNGLVSSDAVDMGWFSPANTSSTVSYSGLFRIASSSTASNPYFRVLATDTNPNTSTTVGGTINTGTLQAYLAPYGSGGVFIANSTAVNITANATVSSTLTVNSITLTTALAATSGGTGQSSYATGDLLYASSSSALSKLSVPGSAANGQVLQITNNLPAYGVLDGGTF